MIRFVTWRTVLFIVLLILPLSLYAFLQTIFIPPQANGTPQSQPIIAQTSGVPQFQPMISQASSTQQLRPVSLLAVNNPESCRIGVYVENLYDFNTVNKTFKADMWIWGLCTDKSLKPLDSMEFLNASSTTISLNAVEQKGGVYWSYMKVTGVFRNNWDTSAYPFDRHILQIVFEESNSDTRSFVYEPERTLSSYNTDMQLADWKITDFRIGDFKHTYKTTFGDPTLGPEQGSSFTQMRVNISIAHTETEYTTFFKLMAPVYIAFAIVLVTFFLTLGVGHRITLLTGALFTIVINMQHESAILGSDTSLTLVDQLHIVALLGILGAVIMLVFSHTWHNSKRSQEEIKRLNPLWFWIFTAWFFLTNVALIGITIFTN